MKFKTVLGVTLTQGKDDELIKAVNKCPDGKRADRMRELAMKGLRWENQTATEDGVE